MGFDVNTAISGDITIGLWFGDHKGEWDLPALAYSFHTAFVEQVRQGLLMTEQGCMLWPVSSQVTLADAAHAGVLQLLGTLAEASCSRCGQRNAWDPAAEHPPCQHLAAGTGNSASIWLLMHWPWRH